MRRPLLSAVALTLGLAATPAVALLDPLTRQPLDYDTSQQNVGVGQQQPQALGKSPIVRETISFSGRYAHGTVIINTAERRLYLVLGDGQAHPLRHRRRPRRLPLGRHTAHPRRSANGRIGRRRRRCCKRRPDLPRHMTGGIDNPLGARAMYLGIDALSHPRLQRARDDRPGGFVRLLPHDQ